MYGFGFYMDMFNSVDVDTMLMKRRQKFFDGYEHMDNLLCQITMSCNCNYADHHFYYYILFCSIILLPPVLYSCLDDEIKTCILTVKIETRHPAEGFIW